MECNRGGDTSNMSGEQLVKSRVKGEAVSSVSYMIVSYAMPRGSQMLHNEQATKAA